MSRNKYTAAQFLKAIPGSGGVITTIAARLQCDRATVQRYIDIYPTIKEAYDSECETVGDIAESVVATNIKAAAKVQQIAIEGENYQGAIVDAADARWYLSKKRKGYSDKTDITNSGEVTIRIVNDR